jgi:ATP-dependent Clp protease adaptor protein ClpS
MTKPDPDISEDIDSKSFDEVDEPPMYRVLIHNDDYTTMEFVVDILMQIFHKSFESATKIMLSVHQQGVGLCGVYTFDVAATKVDEVHDRASEHGFPLKSTMEKEI